ncbi:MAG: Crp/Fnr family transcriptional regulator [Acidobacteriota bacterium]
MGIKPQLLRRCRPFANLPGADLDVLAAIATMRWVDRGEYLYRQKDPAKMAYILFDGAVKLSRTASSGRVLVVDFLGAGALLAERVLLGEPEHLENTCVVEDALVAMLPVSLVTRFLVARPEAIMALARHLAERLGAQETKVAALSTKRVDQRLAEGLLLLAGSHGSRSNGRLMINARITQAELADWLGTTRETVSLQLNELRRAGLIDIVRRRVHLLDTDALCAYAECEGPPADLPAVLGSGARKKESLNRPAC